MSDTRYENMAEKLVEAIPELKPGYDKELEWWAGEDAGAHNIYGDLLNPYLINLLESDDEKETLIRIFLFLEELANHEDIHVQEVVAVTVCERLVGERLLVKARKYMGPKTLAVCREIEQWWKPAKHP